MICPDCKHAADLATANPSAQVVAALVEASPAAAARLRANHARVVAGLHARCPGGTHCCCQHRPIAPQKGHE